MTRPRSYWLALLVALVASAQGFGQQPSSPLRKRTAYEDLQMFSQVLNQIRVNHADSVDSHDLLMAAIEGMVHAADPHSYVIPAARLSPEKDEQVRAGKLVPLPVNFRFVGGSPIVASVEPGSKAARLDVLPGDELVSVDGKPVAAESGYELELSLSGERRSSVKLRLRRQRVDGSLVELERAVERESVAEASAVPAALLLDRETGYIRITTFSREKVGDDLHAAVGQLEGQGMTRLVLDLRDNGGGSVAEAAQVAGEFLPAGALVYISEARKQERPDSVRVHRSFWKKERRLPTIILVNEGTASASELVAGALQDHDRALIVGRPSFGKSLLMRGFPLEDGSLIMLVVGRLRTPCGRVIQRAYQNIVRREYFRLALADRDTAGRPSCRTDGGRVAYGGGGIFPDVMVPPVAAAPVWLAKLQESNTLVQWVGAYVTANVVRYPSLVEFLGNLRMPPAALLELRSFALGRGIEVPGDPKSAILLEQGVLEEIGWVKWGEKGLYSVIGRMDPGVQTAVAHFGEAGALAGVRQ